MALQTGPDRRQTVCIGIRHPYQVARARGFKALQHSNFREFGLDACVQVRLLDELGEGVHQVSVLSADRCPTERFGRTRLRWHRSIR